MKQLLIINSGSSSVKMAVFNTRLEKLATGLVAPIDSPNATIHCTVLASTPTNAQTASEHSPPQLLPDATHARAINALIQTFSRNGLLDTLAGIGHRVVHGGEYFSQSCQISPDTLQKIKNCDPLAPLHNPANVTGITLLQTQFPNCPQIAVFDTAFHQSLPVHAYTYGIPATYYQQFGIRRYGFHGISHKYVAQAAAKTLSTSLEAVNLITVHLGNGCSATAIKAGRSIDTTMGMTPLAGLLMGTRSGDLDPGIPAYLCEKLNCSIHELTEILNKKSGLLGISGISGDMRTVIDAASRGSATAQLAIDVFCYQLAKQIGALAVPLGRLDALVFTGGIGENAAPIRAQTLSHLGIFGFEAEATLNNACIGGKEGLITRQASKAALVIATQEEQQIATETARLLRIDTPAQ